MIYPFFLAHFKAVVTRFTSWKVPKCLEGGLFCDRKLVKNGPFVALSLHDMSEQGPKSGPACAQDLSNCPKINNGPHLGLPS